jgi:HAD superfamily hydrolase (TIGR01549 family)
VSLVAALPENVRMALLLCDLDDTLVDRGRVFGLWADEFVQAHGLPSEDRTWLTDLDNGGITTREHFWHSIKGRVGLRQSVEVLVAIWAIDFPSRYRCEDGVLDSLADARERGWSLGVVTNGDADIQARKLVAAGLDVAVDSVCISGAEGIRKPDRRLFALAAERAGASLASGWMIGDNPQADIAGARGAGLRTVWLSRGRSWPIADFRPDHQVEHPAAAIQLVTVGRVPTS